MNKERFRYRAEDTELLPAGSVVLQEPELLLTPDLGELAFSWVVLKALEETFHSYLAPNLILQ